MDTLKEPDLGALVIVKYPDPVLRAPAAEVRRFDDGLAALAGRMLQIMYAARGVGLAAPQVGVSLRLFVANPAADPGQAEGVYVNPRLLHKDGSVICEEGCLSLPGITTRIKRYQRVTIEAAGLDGAVFRQQAEGLTARVFQHEIDHLDGVLIADRMSTVARLANRRTLKELEDAHQAG